MTLATWINWRGGGTWQRIFDFGNGEDEYMFLTTNAGTNKLRFAIKNGGNEQYIEGNVPIANKVNTWVHVAVTLGEDGVCLYQNGELVGSSNEITIRPADFRPVMNYIGRSQFAADPMFKGSVDDFRVYNYALTAEQISDLYDGKGDGVETAVQEADGGLYIGQLPADRTIEVSYAAGEDNRTDFSIYDTQGRMVRSAQAKTGVRISVSTAGLADGVYILKAVNGKESCSRKFTVRH